MPAKLAEVASRGPSLCGKCSTCRLGADIFMRFREYLANLDDNEPETTKGAVAWVTNAYPRCPPPPEF